MVGTIIRKAMIALFLALLLLIPACSGLSSSSEPRSELRTRWEQAAFYGWPEEVPILLDAGVDVDLKDKDGVTALMIAGMRDRPGVIELLGIAGAANGPEITEVQVGKVIPDSMANEARAIASLKSLVTAELILRSDPQGTYGTLFDLLSAGLIDDRLGSANTDGYIFSVSFSNATFHVMARPLAYRVTGARSFYADETGVIRYTRVNRPATADDRLL